MDTAEEINNDKAFLDQITRRYPGEILREVKPSDADPRIRALEITNEVISILENALEGYLPDEEKHQFLPAFKDEIAAPIERSLQDYDQNRHDQNLALEWENNHLRTEREIPRNPTDEFFYHDKARTMEGLYSLAFKFYQPTSGPSRGETLLGIREDLERKLETFQDFMESNVWKRTQTHISELQESLRRAQSSATFQKNENGKLQKKIEELESRDYDLLFQQMEMEISELEDTRVTLECSLESRTNYDVTDLMFSKAPRWEPTAEEKTAYRRIDLAFLALLNYTDDCNRCEAAINDSNKPISSFEHLLEQAEHARNEAGKLLEQARDSPGTDIAIELTEVTRLYLARIHKIKMQMLSDGIEPPGYAASLRKRAGIDPRPRAEASPLNKDKAHPPQNGYSLSSSRDQVGYNIPTKNSHGIPSADLYETAGSNKPAQAGPGVNVSSACNAANFKNYNQMFLDLELNLKEFIVEQHRREKEEHDFNELIPKGPIDVLKQAKKYGEFLGDEIRESRNLQGEEYEALLNAVNDNLMGFLTNDFRQDELGGARYCEKVIKELDSSLQAFLSNQSHLRDLENDLKVYLTNPDREIKNTIFVEQCNKMSKDLEASIKQFLQALNAPGNAIPEPSTNGEGSRIQAESRSDPQSANEATVETLLGAQPEAVPAPQVQAVNVRSNNFDARNYYFTIHGHRIPLWLLSILALVTVLFASYLTNRSAIENIARSGWLEANSFSRVVYRASWDEQTLFHFFPEGCLILWLGIVPLLIWAVREMGMFAVFRYRMTR